MTALAALTERNVQSSLRDFDLPFSIIVPAATFVGLNLGLRNVIDTGGMDYAQYILPVVVIQAIVTSTLTTADRANRDHWSDYADRIRTLPISPLVPLTARMLYCLLRGALAVAVALATAYVFGFRMAGGLVYTMAFVVLALTLTLALSLGADAIGTRLKRSESSGQLLLVPQLLLVGLSTGIAPAEAFPDWLHAFVRYQPLSQVMETMRGFTTGHVVGSDLASSLAWGLGLLVVLGAIAVRMERRRQ
jgi:ABC-2 type transport system permease protein